MYLLQNNNWRASTLLRSLLAIVFIAWLALVMTQYDEKTIEQKPDISHKPPPSNVVIEQLALPPVPKPKSKPVTKPQASTDPKHAKQPLKMVNNETKQSSTTNKQQVEQVYQQLSNDGVDIQIAWPQQTSDRQAALNFMYQCAGVQFAVLNGNNITKVNQAPLRDYSDWIRVAQGSLSKKEHHWLNAYALTGTPIRLFPREIDWRLAEYLAKALNGSPLVNLRANYQVSNQRLHLTHIQLNNQAITGSWTLYQGECV